MSTKLDETLFQSHLRDLVIDLGRMLRSPGNYVARKLYIQTMAVNLMRLYQADNLEIGDCAKLFEIVQGPVEKQTLINFTLPRGKVAKAIAAALEEELGYNSEVVQGAVLLKAPVIVRTV